MDQVPTRNYPGNELKGKMENLRRLFFFLGGILMIFQFCSTFSELHYFEKSSKRPYIFGGKFRRSWFLALNLFPDDGASKTHVSITLSITICMYICTSAFISTASVTSLCCSHPFMVKFRIKWQINNKTADTLSQKGRNSYLFSKLCSNMER